MDFRIRLWYHIAAWTLEKEGNSAVSIKIENVEEKTKIRRVVSKKIRINEKENVTIIWKFGTDLKIDIIKIERRHKT